MVLTANCTPKSNPFMRIEDSQGFVKFTLLKQFRSPKYSQEIWKRQTSPWDGGGVGSFICTRTSYKEWVLLIVLSSTGCQIADIWRTFFIWSILGILLTKDHWIPMIQKNFHLTSLRRNYVTTLYSVRNHFLTGAFKTIHAHEK